MKLKKVEDLCCCFVCFLFACFAILSRNTVRILGSGVFFSVSCFYGTLATLYSFSEQEADFLHIHL